MMKDVEINFEELCKRLNLRPPTPYEMGIENYVEWDNMSEEKKTAYRNKWFELWVSTKSFEEIQKITQVVIQLMCETDKTYKKYLKKEYKKVKKELKKQKVVVEVIK